MLKFLARVGRMMLWINFQVNSGNLLGMVKLYVLRAAHLSPILVGIGRSRRHIATSRPVDSHIQLMPAEYLFQKKFMG